MKAVLGVLVGLSGLLGTVLDQKPTERVSGDGMKGEYFNGPNFEQKAYTRIDPGVNFDWNWRLPAPGVQREYFSVRWTGKLYAPTSGVYRFTATVDDGVRVWVGGKPVIDQWRKQDDTQFAGQIVLKAGQFYDLKVEYYNDWKGSIISVYWQVPEPQRPTAYASQPMPIATEYLYSSYAKAVAALPKAAPTVARAKPKPSAPMPAASPQSLTGPAIAGRESRGRSQSIAEALPGVARPGVAQPGLARTAANEAERRPEATFNNLNTGRTLVLRNVFFEQSSYQLLNESYAELDKLVRTLRQFPEVRIEIAGHTDNVGDPRLNQALSENRARVVVAYLVRQGIAADRLEARGYGGTRPLAENNTEAGRIQNRRVEFTVR